MFFPFVWKFIAKLEIEVLQVLNNFYFILATILLVFTELTKFNYTLNRNINILKLHYAVGCREKKLSYITPSLPS